MDGRFRIVGTDRSLTLGEIAALPGATADRREGVGAYAADMATYPNGTHICEVEIDPETGRARLDRYTIVDDFGATLNPLLLEGQVHGGVAQAVGQALMEGAVYDERRPAPDRELHGLLHAAGGRFSRDRLRDAQRALDHQPDGAEGRGRSRNDRGDPGGRQRRRRRAVARPWRRRHRHAGDAAGDFRAIRKAEASKRLA